MEYPNLVYTVLKIPKEENRVPLFRPVGDFVGSLEAGLMLVQLLYWTPRSTNDGWVAKSDKDWQDELMLSRYSVRVARAQLEDMGLIETKLTRFAGAPTVHYKLDLETLNKKWRDWTQINDYALSDNPLSETTQSITEPTTEHNSGFSKKTEKPVNFDQWLALLHESKNKNAIIRQMHMALFQNKEAPSFGQVGKVAKHKDIGGHSRLAQLLWIAAAMRPAGDPLRYCFGLARGSFRQTATDAAHPGDSIEQRNGKTVVKLGR